MKEITYEDWRNFSFKERNKFTGVINSMDGSQTYYQNGKLHRVDGPAIIYSNGSVEYWMDDKLHRIDGPARIHYDGRQVYYQNGKRHRIDGPAYKCGNIIGYYINGEQVSKEAQELYYALHKLKGLI